MAMSVHFVGTHIRLGSPWSEVPGGSGIEVLSAEVTLMVRKKTHMQRGRMRDEDVKRGFFLIMMN